MPTRKIPLDKHIIEDYKTMSSGDMALKYGIARGTVCKHLKRLEITRPASGLNSRNRKRNGEVVKTGYPVYHLPNHPRASAIGYVFKHILEIEKHTGKIPDKSNPIHHIDMDRMNYHIDNLYLCKNHSEHSQIHGSLEKVVQELYKKGLVKFVTGVYASEMP